MTGVVLSRQVDPGQIVIVRELLSDPAADDVDTAVFSDVGANYTITRADDGTVTVAHLDGLGADGIDTLRNVERLQFADSVLPGVVTNAAPPGPCGSTRRVPCRAAS